MLELIFVREIAVTSGGVPFKPAAFASRRTAATWAGDHLMNTRWLLVLLAVLVAAPTLSFAEQKEKGRPDPSGLSLWSAKGMPLIVRQYVPGLNAALLLSDAQVEQLYAAWRETVDSPELQEKGRILKTNPNPTEEQQREVRLLYEAAHGRLQSRVAAILTPAQKELVTGIEVLYRAAEEAVHTELSPEFALVKQGLRQPEQVEKLAKERLEAVFLERLSGRLTAEQLTALTHAAAEERRRDAEAAAAPKKR